MSLLFSSNLCATTHYLSSGTNNGLENLIVSSSTVSGDEIVLTDVGPYNCSTPKIVMTKSLTIKAASGLSARPVVKVTATATQSNFFRLHHCWNLLFQLGRNRVRWKQLHNNLCTGLSTV